MSITHIKDFRPSLPRHIAIIMDGNGRWAGEKGWPRAAGHRKGVDAVRQIVEGAAEEKIEYLTLFAFSSENWHRPETEIKELMVLLEYYLKNQIRELHEKNVRLKVIGDLTRFPPNVTKLIDRAVDLTNENTGLTLIIALSYGARDEILQAARKLAEDVQQGKRTVEEIDESSFAQSLFTQGIPDPDLLIRTSGEQRMSNFLLWQCAYTELYFTNKYWPDFSKADLRRAIMEYQNRDRRYGGVK